MKKKLRLRRQVKVTLIIISLIVYVAFIYALLHKGITDYNNAAKRCDKEKGYKCQYNEIKNYIRKGK